MTISYGHKIYMADKQINTMLFVDDSDVRIDYNCTVKVPKFKNPEIRVFKS